MKDLFILGAGASKPYGFPLGSELRDWVIANVKHVIRNNRAIERNKPRDFDVESFQVAFSKSKTASIDLFLSRNRKYEFIGKAAIVHRIIDCEGRDFDYVEDKSDDWYFFFVNHITSGVTEKSDVQKVFENRMFLTFNYDRSFEAYLAHSLYYSFFSTNPISDEVDDKLLPNPDVLHVYGSIGEYPGKPYSNNPRYVHQVSEREVTSIKTIYHEREVNPVVAERISLADRIFFLGFAYLPENMQKLGITRRTVEGKEIFGTAYMSLDAEIRRIERFFEGAKILQIKNVKTLDLLKMYL